MDTVRHPSSPQETMLGMITGYWVSQLIFLVTRLGIADLLASEGPLSPDAIAEHTDVHGRSLRRVLRALASVGVFAEEADGRFRLTPLADTLRQDRPDSLRDVALVAIDDYNWQAWGALEHGVRSGNNPFEHVHKVPAFEFLARHPDKEEAFSISMASLSATQNKAIAGAYPFDRFSTLVDVGGAHGHLLSTVLQSHSHVNGVLYDLPQVVEEAAETGYTAAPEIAGRCAAVGGDFFDSVPEGADGYMMKYIMHDWEDEESIAILENCRKAMAPDGRVLIIDHVIAPGNGADWGKILDIDMFVVTGGKERTRAEFDELVREAGLKLERVIDTDCPLSIVEAAAA